MTIFETSGAPPKGTNAQVVEYWRETYPQAMDAWQRRSRPRQSAAREIFSYLPTSVRPFPVEGKKPVPTPRASSPSPMRGGLFISKAETERGAVSPLEALYPGGVAK